MLLSKRILFLQVFCALVLLLILADLNLPGHVLGGDVQHTVAAREAKSHTLQWWDHYAFAEDAPSIEVLLLRLQELQALLEMHESVETKALSASLFSLSIDIRQTFDGHLFTSYEQLSNNKKKSYADVMMLIFELEKVIVQAEETTSAIKVVI